MTTLQILKRARNKIADRKQWTQFAFARSAGSGQVSPRSRQAVRWCAAGALHAVTTNLLGESLAFLEGFVEDRSLAAYNDSHRHAEVVALFDKAIAILEAQP